MTSQDLFQWLVQYHCRVDWEECIPSFEKGRLVDRYGRPFREGSDRQAPYQGVLIVANGDTLAERLRQDGVIQESSDTVALPTIESLFSYLPTQEGQDGAYIYDGIHRTLTRVGELDNTPPTLPQFFNPFQHLPRNFIFEAGTSLRPEDLGTKSRLAVKLPFCYPHTETYQIKCSAYGSLGMGKVTHFNRAGLVEEVLLRHEPQSAGSFVDETRGIVAIHRRYAHSALGLTQISEKYLDLEAPWRSVNYRHHHSRDVAVAHL